MKLAIKVDGKTYKTEPKNVEKAFEKFGSDVVKSGRAILSKEEKRASGKLFDSFHYKYFEKKNTVNIEFKFGAAENYWRFVDAGVKGSGGYKGSGRARGSGSPFSFGSKQPPSRVIKSWMQTRNIQQGRDKKGRFISNDSLAFLIARSIKQRGLPRTLFFTKAVEQHNRTWEKKLQKAWEKDLTFLWEKKIPKTILTVEYGTLNL